MYLVCCAATQNSGGGFKRCQRLYQTGVYGRLKALNVQAVTS